MNYPIWELTTLGGGSLIALIAVLHVYISHLAVGGGLFIWLTDLKAYREKDKDLNGYVQKHSRFFLLLTMVFGGVTGVGIWFIIALVHPAATSLLIHNFVFGWAIEWVFFLGEIVALLVYVYYFDRLERKHRLNVAFFYFLYAWLSLVVINGILAFMLTPGDWLQTQNFWDGFFNPTYFPSLFFRTFMTMLIAGLFGFVTSVFLADESFRMKMMRYCAKWLLFPLAGLVPSAWWYYAAIPQSIQNTAFILNPQTNPVIILLVVTTILIFVIGIILSLRVAAGMQKALTFLLLLIGLGWMGGFEYSREIARKPFVISDVMYSTAIAKTDPVITQQASLLMAAKWSSIKEITEKNKIEAGKELFNLQCLGCHTLNGIRNDLVEQTKEFTYLGLLALLSGQGKVQTYMPPFAGTEQEKEALAGYLAALQDKDWKEEAETVITSDNSVEIPPYDFKNDEYILLVWNDKGMQFISDADQWFSLMPPGNTLEALLIRRGEVPELVSEDVYLTYEVASGYKNPSQQVKFWEYAQANFNQQPEKNVGLQGKGLSGRFDFD
ncbi:MAG: cytochrome C, partial [Calditrichales bacterium]